MKTILVPLDFSHATEPIIDVVREVAPSLGARVVLIHVEPPGPALAGYEPGPQHAQDIVAHDVQENHNRLDDAQKGLH